MTLAVLGMLGTTEIVVLILIVLLVLGPTKLPQLGVGIGKMLRGFKKEMRQLDEDRPEDEDRRGPAGEIDVTPHPNKGGVDERKGA